MATILNDAAYMALPMNIKRGNPIPLDTTAVWYDKTKLETYAASGATAYVGQILTLYAGGKCEAYMISNEDGTLVKLAQTTASGDLASDVATLQSQVNNLVAKIGAPAAGEDAATGLYKDIADVLAIANKGVTDAKTAQDAANAAQSGVDNLKAVVGTDDTAGLRKRIKDNEDAIGTLRGTDTGKSARAIAAEEVAKIVANADADFDTLKEIADWISGHKTDATAMNTAITKLEGIVAGIGGEGEKATVVAYVTDAIAALKIGDYAKAADLTALAARVKTLEDSPAARITSEKIAAWDAKQNAGNYVDQTAYADKISALETADSDNAKAIAAVKTTADAAVPKNAAATSGTATKVTVDSNGLVIGLGELAKTDIPTIDQDQVSGLATALAGKQDTVSFNTAYDASTNKAATMSDIGDAKSALVGTADDTSTVDTIKGAKKYADEKASAALSSAKEYADSIVTGTGGITSRVETLEGKVDVAKVSTAIATAKNEAIAAAEEKDAALKTVILGTGHTGTVKEAAAAAKAADDKAVAAQTAVDTLSNKVGTIADGKTAAGLIGENATAISGINSKIGAVTEGKTVVEMIADAKTAATYNDTEVRNLITANKTAIDTLIGSVDGDNAKSAREMAHEEVAKVVDGAPESFDTLKEISSWISTHSDSAVTMDNSIKANAAAIEKLNGADTVTGSVAKAVKDGVTPVANRVTAIENKVTDEKVAKWDAAQANKIESIKVGDTALTIGEDKSVALPAATAAALGLVKVDGTSIESKNGVIGVKAVNVSTLYVADGDELVLNGGNA